MMESLTCFQHTVQALFRPAPPRRSRVLLHVYELGRGTALAAAISGLNLIALGAGGAFHAAIEIVDVSDGLEWSYGHVEQGSGVYAVRAKAHPSHKFKQTLELGETSVTRSELIHLILAMQELWLGSAYQIVQCNCITFCRAFSTALGVGPVPQWVDRLSRVVAAPFNAAGSLSQAVREVVRPPQYAECVSSRKPPERERTPSGSRARLSSADGATVWAGGQLTFVWGPDESRRESRRLSP